MPDVMLSILWGLSYLVLKILILIYILQKQQISETKHPVHSYSVRGRQKSWYLVIPTTVFMVSHMHGTVIWVCVRGSQARQSSPNTERQLQRVPALNNEAETDRGSFYQHLTSTHFHTHAHHTWTHILHITWACLWQYISTTKKWGK